MPPLSYELINHFRELQPVLFRLGLDATVNVRDLSLEVRYGTRGMLLHPQFTQPRGDAVVYVPAFSRAVKRFIGWRPAYERAWPLSLEKLAFKRFMNELGLPTPRYAMKPSPELSRVIVKKNKSSFSEGIRGPFASPAGVALDASQGEYFEEFIPGHIIKIWYWNAEPVAVEETEMLNVIGDGVLSIGQLVMRHVYMLGIQQHDLKQYESFLAYQGKTLRTVPARDEVCVIEFRYNSELPTLRMRDIRVGSDPFHGLEPMLKTAGAHLWRSIPAQHRHGVVFSVDAMLDPDLKLWFLEMNSNPYVHPYLYPPMMESIKHTLASIQGTSPGPGPDSGQD